MKILITGVNGFVGKKLFKTLAEKHEVHGVFNSGEVVFKDCYRADLTSFSNIHTVFNENKLNDLDAIVHLASKTANSENLEDLNIIDENNRIAKNIAIISKEFSVKKVINLSSSSIYPNIDGTYNENSLPDPSVNSDGFYGLSKFNSEIILKYFLSNTTVKLIHLRSGIIYGEGMEPSRLIPILENEILERNTVTLYGEGNRLLNIIAVNSLIEHITFFLNYSISDTFNISDETISVRDLAQRIIEKKGNLATKIISHKKGNRQEFILDTKKLKTLFI